MSWCQITNTRIILWLDLLKVWNAASIGIQDILEDFNYKVYRLTAGLSSQLSGTTAQWFSNKLDTSTLVCV